jgi:hypothetical protein
MNSAMIAMMSKQQNNPSQQLLSMFVADCLRSPTIETQQIVAPSTAVAKNTVQPPTIPKQIDLPTPKKSHCNYHRFQIVGTVICIT